MSPMTENWFHTNHGDDATENIDVEALYDSSISCLFCPLLKSTLCSERGRRPYIVSEKWTTSTRLTQSLCTYIMFSCNILLHRHGTRTLSSRSGSVYLRISTIDSSVRISSTSDFRLIIVITRRWSNHWCFLFDSEPKSMNAFEAVNDWLIRWRSSELVEFNAIQTTSA